jgi:hypothetical protein
MEVSAQGASKTRSRCIPDLLNADGYGVLTNIRLFLVMRYELECPQVVMARTP